MKMAVVESNPDPGLSAQTFCFSPDILATANMMSTMTKPIASDPTNPFSNYSNVEHNVTQQKPWTEDEIYTDAGINNPLQIICLNENFCFL